MWCFPRRRRYLSRARNEVASILDLLFLVHFVFYFYGSLDGELHGWRWKDYTPYGFAL
jgi:hypothetical protein